MIGRASALDVPLKAPFRIATGEVTAANNVLFHVSADGVAGVGEAAPFTPITGGTQAQTLADLQRLTLAGKPGPGATPAQWLEAWGAANLPCDARGAIDAALHDWAARKKGVSLARLLGGAPREFATSVTVPIVPLSEVPAIVRRGLDAGFSVLKVKSKAGIEEETKRVKLVRDLAGSKVEVRVDANAGWSRGEAEAMLPALRSAEVAFLEQPLARTDLTGHARLVQLRSLPIMVDESVFTLADAQRVVAAGAADLINVKLAKAGGLAEAGRILSYAKEQGVDCMVGCMIETRIAIASAAHLASAFPAVKHVDLDGHTFLREDPTQAGVEIRRGRLVVPDTPGHGATLRAGARVTSMAPAQ